MGIHFDVHVNCRSHGEVPKLNIKVHPSIQLEGALIVGMWNFVSLLEIALPELGHSSHLLEQGASNDSYIGATVNEAIARNTLYLHPYTLGNALFVGDSHSPDIRWYVLL